MSYDDNMRSKCESNRIYTCYYLFSPLYRQFHLALADEPETARCHYLTPIDKFIDKFIQLLIIYYSLAKILLATSQILLKFYFTS